MSDKPKNEQLCEDEIELGIQRTVQNIKDILNER